MGKLRVLKTVISALLSSVLLAGGIITGIAMSYRTTYTIVDGENTTTVTTWKAEVSKILETAGLEVGEHDEVTPKLQTALYRDNRIEIKRATAYNLQVNGKPQTIWSTAKTWEEILQTVKGKQLSLSIPRDSKLPLQKTAGKLPVTADGKTTEIKVNTNTTVQNAVDLAKLQLTDLDEVAFTKRGGKLGIKIIRITKGNVTEEVETPFETEIRESVELPKGEERVLIQGVKGITKVTYYRYTKDGKTLVNKEVSRVVATEKVNKVIIKGTLERPGEKTGNKTTPQTADSATKNPAKKPAETPVKKPAEKTENKTVTKPKPAEKPGEKPAPKPQPEPAPKPDNKPTPKPQPKPTPIGDEVWVALAQCESGGDPTINTGNGYYGLYQFSLRTWQWVGGTGYPHENSAEEQTKRAKILQSRLGWGQWPGCARKLGLL